LIVTYLPVDSKFDIIDESLDLCLMPMSTSILYLKI